ncbi:MAG TPA: metallophosphoesterase family protein [Anaerolineae bacterium]
MRVLVVSDIHANLTALEAVIDDAGQFDFQAVWCLGDTVGYGPEPNECIARIRELGAVAVVGNHDWAVLGGMDIDDFNQEARRGVLWTREHLTPENLSWLGALPGAPIQIGDFTLTHGSPRDPVWEYILYPSIARANLDYFTTPFCLIGHTHVPVLYLWQAADGNLRTVPPPPGQTLDLWPAGVAGGSRGLLNPGSVGQPRDNDPRAAYAILDTEQMTWLSRRVVYPVEITQARMRQAALPERLINRIAYGW